MAKERKIAHVITKMTLAEADEQEMAQWAEVPFEELWASLERMRRLYYSAHNMPFPEKMERVINIMKRDSTSK